MHLEGMSFENLARVGNAYRGTFPMFADDVQVHVCVCVCACIYVCVPARTARMPRAAVCSENGTHAM